MADQAPPPAYSAVDNGEGGAPPPSYNQQAASVPAYNPSAPVSNPSAPSAQPNIKYVDQNGNPVNPPVQQPTANIKYVDQNGNPVAPPVQQPAANIKYVDQYGNPVNPPAQASSPTSNIKYVDQYGNPVAPPVQQPAANIKYVDQYGNPIQAPAQATANNPNIKYVDQYGNPVAAPVGVSQPNIKYVDQYGNPVSPPNTAVTGTTKPGVIVAPGAGATTTPQQRSVKSMRIASAVLGAIALLILFIGLCVDNLARGYPYVSGYYDMTYTCGWTQFKIDCGDTYSYLSSDSCTDQDHSYADLCDIQSSGFSGDGPSWCGTRASASLALVTMLAATIFCLIGVVFVQPWCKITACCCKTNPNCGCARTSFVFCIAFSILTLIIWFAGDEVCLSSDSYSSVGVDMGTGGSMVCQIIGLIFAVISAALAK